MGGGRLTLSGRIPGAGNHVVSDAGNFLSVPVNLAKLRGKGRERVSTSHIRFKAVQQRLGEINGTGVFLDMAYGLG